MMRFRRKHRSFRRKRPGMMMLPMSLCDEVETWAPSSGQCIGEGRVVALQLHPALQGNESRGVAQIDPARPQALVQQTLRKTLTVRGIRFYFALGLNQVEDDQGAEVLHEVRCAVVNLETDSVGTPVFLPNLWTNLGPELGDVLWRGFGVLYQPQTAGNYNNNVGQAVPGAFFGSGLGFRGMYGNFGGYGGVHPDPIHVRTSRRLGENNALFFVYSVRNNNPPGETGAGPDIETGLNLFGVAAVRSNSR